jgi:Tat protein secretion system quality control protein TatD with DNase activity
MFERTIKLAQGAAGSQAVAIGEVGLDYHYDFSRVQFSRQYLRNTLNCLGAKAASDHHSREATEADRYTSQ